jgi:sodium/potassium-transporting ATPase subunit beta
MAGGDAKTNDTKAASAKQYQFAQKPEEKPGWEGFKQFVWNTETSEFLGRTGSSWFKIGVFYVIYYAFLTGFFAAMLVIFYQTLDEKVPKWQNSNGIIGTNPGVGFRPRPSMDSVESTLVYFRHGELGNWQGWKDRLDNFLSDYKEVGKKPKPQPNHVECSFESLPGEDQFCMVQTNELITGPCTEENNYGYDKGKPCILIKLNKIYGWLPEPYNHTKLPSDMPESLTRYINSSESGLSPKEKDEMIWFSCEGENPADAEHIGQVDYYPRPGVPSYFYPYKNQDGYLSPVVFAHFSNPKHGVLISITCKAWSKNIEHEIQERRGTAHFELMID